MLVHASPGFPAALDCKKPGGQRNGGAGGLGGEGGSGGGKGGAGGEGGCTGGDGGDGGGCGAMSSQRQENCESQPASSHVGKPSHPTKAQSSLGW